MVAGPNGAGKTTLTKWLREQGVDFGEYINPDDIARELGVRDGGLEPAVTVLQPPRITRAQMIADGRRDACIEARRSFSFETVMSHPSKVDLLVRAKKAGFFVQLFFVGTDDPQTNIERVALRVAQGGHDVPEDRIVARWHRTMALLERAVRVADRAFVFDNSAAGHVGRGPRLVFWADRTRTEEIQPSTQQYPPTPDWVRRYVLDRLGIDPISA